MGTRHKTDDIQKFNRWAGTYENSWSQQLFFDRVQKAVLDLVESERNPETILDVGCGTGRLLRKVRERWPTARLIGIDPAESMIEKARQLTPSATFYVSIAESLPLPDASIDLAFSTVSFHHWLNQVQGLRQITRVLRPGGRFYLADTFWLWPIRHFRCNNPTRIREMFAQAGLDVKAQRRRRILPSSFLGRFLLLTIGERI